MSGGPPARGVVGTRRALLASATGGAPALLAACGGVPPPPPPAPAGVPRRAATYTVRVRVWGDAADGPVYDAIQTDFNAQHSDVRMACEHPPPDGPAVPGYYEALGADVAAGTAADLATFQGGMWQEFAGKGALQPVDDLASRDRWTAPWLDDTAYDLQTRFRGKRYLSPTSTATLVMFFAREPFDRAGIPYPREGWTYTEFQDLNRRLTRRVEGRQVYAYQWNGGYLRNAPWWRMNGHLEWDRIAEPRKAGWNAGPLIEAYQYQLYDSQYKLQIAPTRALLEADPAGHLIEHGGVAMKVEGPWFLSRMWGPQAPRAGGTPFDVQLLPRGKAQRTPHMNLIEGQAMTRQSKDKEAAWEVMRWIGGERGQQRIAEGGRMCNVPDAIRKFWLPAVSGKYNLASAEVFVKAIEGASITFVSEVTEALLDRDTGLSRALADVRDGKATPRGALDALQPRIQQLLDAYWAGQSAGR